MADVETPRNDAAQTPEPAVAENNTAADPSTDASMVVCEENLLALMGAVTARPPSKPSIPPAPVAQAPLEPPPTAELPVTPRIHAPVIPASAPAETPVQEPPPATAEPKIEDTAEYAESATDTAPDSVLAKNAPSGQLSSSSSAVQRVNVAAPTVEPQSEANVGSKLALLASIKQRRATTPRPEVEVSSARRNEPVLADAHLPEVAPVVKVAPTARAAPTVDAKPFAPPAPAVEVAPTKRAPRPEPIAKAAPQKPDLAAKKSPDPATESVAAGQTPLKRPAASAAYSAPLTNAPFSSVKADSEGTAVNNLKAFATSRVGLGTIGGAIAAAGLIAYLLMGHGGKTATSTTKPQTGSAAQSANVSTQAGGAGQTVSSGQTVASNIPTAVPPAIGQAAAQKPPAGKPAEVPGPPVANLNKDDKSAAKSGPPQAVPVAPPQPSAEAPPSRPVARTFAPPPPTGKAPVSGPILDAPPALSAAAPAAPLAAAVTLPSGITTLAPPPPSPPAAPKVSAPRQVVVSGPVQASKLARQVVPTYPPLARATRVQGTVRFRATIGIDGQVKGLVLLGGPPPLVQGATDAVKQWRYQPTLVNGEPVEVVTEVDVAFTL